MMKTVALPLVLFSLAAAAALSDTSLARFNIGLMIVTGLILTSLLALAVARKNDKVAQAARVSVRAPLAVLAILAATVPVPEADGRNVAQQVVVSLT